MNINIYIENIFDNYTPLLCSHILTLVRIYAAGYCALLLGKVLNSFHILLKIKKKDTK